MSHANARYRSALHCTAVMLKEMICCNCYIPLSWRVIDSSWRTSDWCPVSSRPVDSWIKSKYFIAIIAETSDQMPHGDISIDHLGLAPARTQMYGLLAAEIYQQPITLSFRLTFLLLHSLESFWQDDFVWDYQVLSLSCFIKNLQSNGSLACFLPFIYLFIK